MEKLIKLLNEWSEYEEKKWHFRNYEWVFSIRGPQAKRLSIPDEYLSTEESEVIIISKSYGFIKRLVDNDKINREKIDGLKLIPTLTYQNMIDDCDCGKSHWHPYTFAGYVDELLMLLAISDTPIDDLISYLK